MLNAFRRIPEMAAVAALLSYIRLVNRGAFADANEPRRELEALGLVVRWQPRDAGPLRGQLAALPNGEAARDDRKNEDALPASRASSSSFADRSGSYSVPIDLTSSTLDRGRP